MKSRARQRAPPSSARCIKTPDWHGGRAAHKHYDRTTEANSGSRSKNAVLISFRALLLRLGRRSARFGHENDSYSERMPHASPKRLKEKQMFASAYIMHRNNRHKTIGRRRETERDRANDANIQNTLSTWEMAERWSRKTCIRRSEHSLRARTHTHAAATVPGRRKYLERLRKGSGVGGGDDDCCCATYAEMGEGVAKKGRPSTHAFPPPLGREIRLRLGSAVAEFIPTSNAHLNINKKFRIRQWKIISTERRAGGDRAEGKSMQL